MGCTPSTPSTRIEKRNIHRWWSSPACISVHMLNHQEEFEVDSGRFAKLQNGRIRNHYKIGRKLGTGAYGYVREAVHKNSKQRRAIKKIQKDIITRDLPEKFEFLSEVDIVAGLDHPNIVKLYEFYEDDKYFHLVTEFIGGGEFFDYIIRSKLLSEPIAAHFMRQILSGVAFCHSKNIVHSDIKPENLLLDLECGDSILKIINFGISSNTGCRLTQNNGTAYCIAPEVLKGDYDEKCDVWSCGVILYILLFGKPPFYGGGVNEIIARVEKGEYSLREPGWDLLSSASKNFIKKLLEYNPKKRITAQQALKDEWITRFTSSSIQQSPPISLDNLVSFRSGKK